MLSDHAFHLRPSKVLSWKNVSMAARCMSRAPMRLALASSRKSSCSLERPLADIRTCERVNAIMDVSVPISGVKPFLGPTMVSDSSAGAASEVAVKRGAETANAVAVFRKARRVGQQSQGVNAVMGASG